ncbi:MAG TPA: hypothetical protein VFZ61_08110, partial [Polyangiales bacterium]
MQSFARALEALREDVEHNLGDADVVHIRRVRRLSRRLQGVGRGLIHFSLDPGSWAVGVVALTG